MQTALLFLVGVAQALLLLLLAPLLSGMSRVLRAKFHSRQGPPILQDYRDLGKLLARAEIIPAEAGVVFRVTPYVLLVAMLLVAMAIPGLMTRSPVSATGDLIAVIYLFALGRFFFALAGVDSGSMFGGIGACRETTLAVLNEPVMVLSLFVVALLAGSTNLGVISASIFAGPTPAFAATAMAMVAFAFATFLEMGKLPLDLAEAEQELQEGPLTEYSGCALGLFKWGLFLKQTVTAALFLGIFVPAGAAARFAPLPLALAAVVLVLKLVIVFLVISLVENTMARLRFLSSSGLTFVAASAALLAFAFSLAGI
ncbi:MAG: NADH-quinone oxidoreductase subunit H [Alphaproteobacteria bacterium]|nr:NADH-quinone oxidoreductase subunit H [Alphaproteobacteria bacterium]